MRNTRHHAAYQRALACALGGWLLAQAPLARADASDFCACAGRQSFGAFDTNDDATWQPLLDAGLSVTNNLACGPDTVTIQLPPDGVLVFDSLHVSNARHDACNAQLAFRRNDANTPVTILVKGDVTITSGETISVVGGDATSGSTGSFGVGGAPGAGGFAGGDGAYQLVNFASTGGTGVGPGGGSGSTPDGAAAGGGGFAGLPELRPLLGGSGGGGGRSTGAGADCSGGGGGGGGGAILIAANGTIDVQAGGQILADGGNAGHRDLDSCSSGGGGGSGGALRLVARTIQGSGAIFARGGNGGCCGSPGNGGLAGSIRMEAISNTFRVDGSSPIATRAFAPGPLVNPIAPTVRITAIDGHTPPASPTGFLGKVEDVLVAAPGNVQVDLATTDVPTGTQVEVAVKPKVGGAPTLQRVTLDPAGCTNTTCQAAIAFDLAAGTYIVEARATFEAP